MPSIRTVGENRKSNWGKIELLLVGVALVAVVFLMWPVLSTAWGLVMGLSLTVVAGFYLGLWVFNRGAERWWALKEHINYTATARDKGVDFIWMVSGLLITAVQITGLFVLFGLGTLSLMTVLGTLGMMVLSVYVVGKKIVGGRKEYGGLKANGRVADWEAFNKFQHTGKWWSVGRCVLGGALIAAEALAILALKAFLVASTVLAVPYIVVSVLVGGFGLYLFMRGVYELYKGDYGSAGDVSAATEGRGNEPKPSIQMKDGMVKVSMSVSDAGKFLRAGGQHLMDNRFPISDESWGEENSDGSAYNGLP